MARKNITAVVCYTGFYFIGQILTRGLKCRQLYETLENLRDLFQS